MKKVITLLSLFLCMFASAFFGAFGCGSSEIEVVAIGIAGVSDNLVKEDGSDKYLVRKGETFTITYEIKPSHATDLTTYVDMTPANRVSTDISIFRTKEAKNTVTFKSSSINIGETLIKFQTKDGGETVSVLVEIIDDDRVFSTPQNIKYVVDSQTGFGEFTWDKCTAETTNGIIEASKYALFINDEKIETDTNSYKTELQGGTDYYVRVQALGDLKTRTSDSERSSDVRFYIAETPKNFKVSNGVVSWDYSDEDNIDQFILEFGQQSQYKVYLEKDVRSFNLVQHIRTHNIEGLGNFNIKLTAVNTAFVNGAPNSGNIMTYILNSRNNPTASLTQLYAPSTLTLTTETQPGDIYSSTILEWAEVTSATSYLLSVYKNGQQLGQITSSRNYINLSKAEFVQDAVTSKTAGEYTIKVVPQGGSNTFIEEDDYATLDFVITPFLYGSVNYSTDQLNLNTQDLLTMLGLTTDDLSTKFKYEVYYSENSTGYYNNVLSITEPSSTIDLSKYISMEYAYNILVRPVPSAGYTTKNIVLPMVDEIYLNRTLSSMVSQLKPVTISNISSEGVLTGTDTNSIGDVDSYRFELTGAVTSTQTLYKNNSNLVFDSNTFTISVVELFNIQNAGDYTIRIVPVSSTKIDANPTACTNYAFKQLGSVDTATIEIDNNVISWENVANYYSYSIKINDEEDVEVNDNSYTIEDGSILQDNNLITIKVNGNGTNTINGTTASITKPRAVAVTGFEVVNGVLTWEDSVANSTYYITITYPQENIEKVVVNTNSYSGLDKIATSATITISRGVPTAFNSVESADIDISRLTKPTNDLAIINHTSTAQFTPVSNAYSYNVIIKQGSTTIKEYIISTNGSEPNASVVEDKIQFTISELSAGNYTIFIQAIPSNQDSDDYTTNGVFYLISNLSDNNDFVVYPQIQITSKTHTLNWSFDSTYSVKDYTISFVNDEYEDVITVGNSYSFAEIDAGTYDLVLSVSSIADNVIYPNNTSVTITKTATPTIAYNQGKIEFTLVNTAIEYKVYGADDTLLQNNVDYKMTVVESKAYIEPLNLQENVDYSIYIIAIGDTDILDGDKSNVVEFSIIDSASEIALTTIESKKTFTWAEVESSSGYFITLSKNETTLETETLTTNSYTIPDKYFSGTDKFVAETYTLSIVVLSDTLVNSNPVSVNFTKLGVISSTDLNDNIISWQYAGDGTPNAYELSVLTYQSEVWVEEESFSVTHVNGVTPEFDLDNLTEYNNYQILITVKGSDANFTLDGEKTLFTYKYGESDEYTGETFTKIEAPTFSYNNGKLQLEENVEAGSYELYSVSEGSYSLLTYEYSLDDSLYITLVSSDVDYTLVAKAIVKDNIGKLNSDYSEEIKVNKLTTISDLAVDGSGLISWTADENASSYIVYNITTGQSLALDGQATDSVTYEYLYTQFGLDLGSSNEFKVVAVGNTKEEINYLNSEQSNSVVINAVENISTISMQNGLLTWDDIEGVSAYKLDIVREDTGITLKSVVVNTNSHNINNYAEITNGLNVIVKVIPCSTLNNNYIIADAVNATAINVQRYDVIDAISVENGLLKFKLDISGISLENALAIINADDYSLLSDEIQQGYYGYYNFKLNVNGTNINITLNNMSYTVDLTTIATGVFYATYNLAYNVQSTTLLNIQISSVGNTANNSVSYGAISSIPSTSNNTILSAYKHAAPIPTVNSNLIGSGGYVEFKKIIGVDKYILTAVSEDEVLTYNIDTTLSTGETYSLGNVSSLSFTDSDGNTKGVEGDIEYTYTLTTLGTESGDSGDLYLRSNPYTTTSILFLSKPSLRYVYNNANTLGGYVSWSENKQALSYKLYALNVDDAKSSYLESEIDNVKTNSLWINNENVYTCEIGFEYTSYAFENAGFSHGVGIDEVNDISLPNGTYWLAVQAVGNGTTCITPAGCNNTIEIYKVNPVISSKLENGEFKWQVTDADKTYVKGFKIAISVFVAGMDTKVIKSPTIMSTISGDNVEYTYVLDELFTDASNTTHTLNGFSASGAKESYGISVIAVGGNVNGKNCVNSIAINIDNSGSGYERLDTSILAVENGELIWSIVTQSVTEVDCYHLYVNGVATDSFDNVTTKLSFSDEMFETAGDYALQIKAMAKSNNYLSSALSQTLTAVKFHAPILTTQNGVLVWNNSNNGVAHQPISSTLTINSDAGDQVYTNQFSEFTFALDDKNTFPEGYYNAFAKYDGYYDESNAVYYIASEEVSLRTYKLGLPVICDVANFLASNDSEKECQNFGSAIKWAIIQDENGQDIVKYKIVVSVYNGFDFVVDEDLSATIENVKNSIYDEANADNTTLIVKNGYVYYNISDLAENDKIRNSKVQISVVALGSTDEENSIYQLNSSKGVKEIDYAVEKPNVDESDGIYGIIRWSGSENPVYITIQYGSEASPTTENIYLDVDYIAKYGKVYYLPYMTTYYLVELRYVIGGFYLGNSNSVNVSEQTLFASGDGTESNPYLITEASQIQNVQYRPLSHIRIASSSANLALSGNWTTLERFGGVFDGNGSTISNIAFTTTSLTSESANTSIYRALFNQLLEGGVIKNVALSYNTYIGSSGTPIASKYNVYVAGVVINNYGTIENVTITGSIQTYSQKSVYFGGVSINNYGTINEVDNGITTNINCSPTDGNLSTTRLYGGGITYANDGIVDSCAMSGSINMISLRAKTRQASGVVVINRGIILNSDFTGSLSAFDMAGIASTNNYLLKTFEVSKKYSTDASATTYSYSAGTILGCLAKGTMTIASSEATTSGNIYVAGIVGINNGGFIGKCYTIRDEGTLDFTNILPSGSAVYVGGLVAFNSYRLIDTVYYAPEVQNSYAIVKTKYVETSNSIESGAVIGAFAQTLGLDFSYGTNYCLNNVVYYCSSSAFGSSTNITISNTSVLESLSSESGIVDEVYKTKLNNVSDDDKYSHIRVFYLTGTELSLRLEKTIEN